MAPDCAYFTDTETYSNLNIVKLLFKVKMRMELLILNISRHYFYQT